MDAFSIVSAVESLKAAKDIAQALYGLKVTSEVQDKVSQLLRLLLEAQAQTLAAQLDQRAMTERVRELEMLLQKAEDWAAGRDRYCLRAVGEHAFAYAPKPESGMSEPDHLLCCRCFHDGTKSVLQYLKADFSHDTLKCFRCSEEVRFPHNRPIRVVRH